MFFLLEKMVPICISCLLLGTIKQLHWDDLRKSRSQEIGISDSWDLRPRRTWQSLDLAAISVAASVASSVAANFSLSQWSPFFTQGGPVFLSSQFSSSKLSLWIAGDFSTSLFTAAYLALRREASANSSATVFSSSVSPGAWDDSQASARTHCNSLQCQNSCCELDLQHLDASPQVVWYQNNPTQRHELETGESW